MGTTEHLFQKQYLLVPTEPLFFFSVMGKTTNSDVILKYYMFYYVSTIHTINYISNNFLCN